MQIKLPLRNPSFDDDRIDAKTRLDFDKDCQIYIYKSEQDWINDPSQSLFSVCVEYGENIDKSLMFDANLDDLEEFAAALTKSIEMIRRDYGDVIKQKIIHNHRI